VSVATTTRTVTCPECGATWEVSVRQRRRILNNGGDLRCTFCRTVGTPFPVTPRERSYWLDRYPIDWIRETGQMIWGPHL
jgi:hypothetical protein